MSINRKKDDRQPAAIDSLLNESDRNERRLDKVHCSNVFRFLLLLHYQRIENKSIFGKEVQYAYCKKLFLEAVQQTDEHYLDTMPCVLDDIIRCMGLDPHLVLRRKSDEGV